MTYEQFEKEDDVYTLLDRIVCLHELQASLKDIDIEIAKARVLLDSQANIEDKS